jgi:hypothetical protein
MNSLKFSNIGNRCRAVNLVEPKPTIDLSDVTFFEPFALVYLGMFLRHFNSQGRSFGIIPPKNDRAREYLAGQQFWNRFNFNPHVIKEENLRRFTTSTSLSDIADVKKDRYVAEELAEAVADVVEKSAVRLRPSVVAEVTAELVQNFVEHSDQTLAAFMVQYYRHRGPAGTLVMAIGDCGKGIRTCLSAIEKYDYLVDQPHHQAILKALEPGVSSKRGGGGTGFSEMLDYVTELQGEFRIATGDEYMIVSGKTGKARAKKMGFHLTGVQIELILPGRL